MDADTAAELDVSGQPGDVATDGLDEKADIDPIERLTEFSCYRPGFADSYAEARYPQATFEQDDHRRYVKMSGYLGANDSDIVDAAKFRVSPTLDRPVGLALTFAGTHQAEQAGCITVMAHEDSSIRTKQCVGYGDVDRWAAVVARPGDDIYLTMVNNVDSPTNCNQYDAFLWFFVR